LARGTLPGVWRLIWTTANSTAGRDGKVFRFKRSVRSGYDRQGYIYFTSKAYRRLPEGKQRKIRELCRESGGEYWRAVLEFVTTDDGADAICLRHSLSRSTLERRVKAYYESFPEDL
jgi:hypothetical protein